MDDDQVYLVCPKCAKTSYSGEWQFGFSRDKALGMGNHLRLFCPKCKAEVRVRTEAHTYILHPIGYVKEDF